MKYLHLGVQPHDIIKGGGQKELLLQHGVFGNHALNLGISVLARVKPEECTFTSCVFTFLIFQ